MRKPSPLHCLTSLLCALAASSAYAAIPVATTGMPAASAASPAPVVTGTPPAATGSAVTTNSNTTSTNTTATSNPGNGNGATIRNENSSFSNQGAIGPTTDAASFGPNSSFTNDNGNPELGLSPGQTSSGTAAGIAPNGLDVGSTLDTNPGATIGLSAPAGTAGAFVPGNVMGGGGFYGGASGGGGTAVGGTAIAVSPRAGGANGSATPLLDQATRNAEQREAHRRASGNSPRIIGIAPRTDADRTDEMPDDPIIRY